MKANLLLFEGYIYRLTIKINYLLKHTSLKILFLKYSVFF